MQRARMGWALVVGLVILGGCRHMIPPPYPRGQGPSPATLLDHTGAQLQALQVSRAKVIANRTLRGNLAFIAEAPGRFRGSVDVAGNELVTLAFHEQGYALRYKMDAFPTGFYQGPPSACAVEALLGVSFETEGLVDLVLGGAPVIDPPHQVLEQQWSKRWGYESLTIANDRFVQELRFGWVDGQWRVVGGQLWERAGDQKGRRLWTVEHLELETVGGVVLPTKTRVSTPGKRRDDTVVINYKERDLDPAFAKRRTPNGSGSGSGSDDGGDDGGWENDDPWEDGDEGWEDEGWEDGEASPAEGEADEGAAPEGEGAPDGPGASGSASHAGLAAPTPGSGPTPTPKAGKGGPPSIPPEFLLEPAGLTVRGDLCR